MLMDSLLWGAEFAGHMAEQPYLLGRLMLFQQQQIFAF